MSTPNDPGNAAMVRHLAGQFFEEWESRQGRRRASWQSWGALILSAAGIIYMAGSLSGDVAIAKTGATENRSAISNVDSRLSRIEGKLDMLMEDRRK